MTVNPLPVHGVDLSHNNMSVDLQQAKNAGLQFVYHKATQGRNFDDILYLERRKDAARLGIPFGAYHFCEATSSPEEQMAHFLRVARVRPGDMRPMIDVEDYAAGGSFFSKMSIETRSDWVMRAVQAVENALGITPFIYTPYDLTDTFGCPLWVARYSNTNALPNVPEPWDVYTLRQFSDGVYGVPNTFPGLAHADLNTWRVPKDAAHFLELNRLVGPNSTRGPKVDAAIDALAIAQKRAKNEERQKLLARALKVLKKIPFIK